MKNQRNWRFLIWMAIACLAVPGAPVVIALEGQLVWNWFAEGVFHLRRMSFEEVMIYSAMLALFYYTPSFLILPGELELASYIKRKWWDVLLDVIVVTGIWGMAVLILATGVFAAAALLHWLLS